MAVALLRQTARNKLFLKAAFWGSPGASHSPGRHVHAFDFYFLPVLVSSLVLTFCAYKKLPCYCYLPFWRLITAGTGYSSKDQN